VVSLADLSTDDLDLLLSTADEEGLRLLHRALTDPYYAFQPREDDPAEFDEQTSFVNDNTSKFAICLGGTGSGKTLAAAHKTARYVLERPPQRTRLPFWIIGESFDQICQAAWVEKLATIIPEECIADYQWYRNKRQWPYAVLLKHPTIPDEVGWILEFKSYEQGFGGMKAVSIGGYWCNEELPYHLLFEIQGRCRDYSSPGWADFTPVECKDPEWIEAYEDPPRGWKFYHLNNLKNTAKAANADKTIAEWATDYLATVPEELREMRQTGKFSVLRGAVFKEFRKSVHVIEPRRIPREWRKIRGLDFGFNNPTCCLWIARDNDGIYYVYDEYYRAQASIDENVAEIDKREWEYNQPWYGPTYSDHEATIRNEYILRGIPCIPANKSRNPGIELLRSLMIQGRNGKPRLYIFSTCKNLIKEIQGYRYPEGTTGRNPKDEPIDKDDHAVDALRMAIFTDFHRGSGHKAETHQVLPDHKRHGVMFTRG
jgi:phage terminase large subunit